jgi:hypothetical protein
MLRENIPSFHNAEFSMYEEDESMIHPNIVRLSAAAAVQYFMEVPGVEEDRSTKDVSVTSCSREEKAIHVIRVIGQKIEAKHRTAKRLP